MAPAYYIDRINVDNYNILFNGQPYQKTSVRLRFPMLADDNTVTILFPWWSGNVLWTGDVTTLFNLQTLAYFLDVAEFKSFCNTHIFK